METFLEILFEEIFHFLGGIVSDSNVGTVCPSDCHNPLKPLDWMRYHLPWIRHLCGTDPSDFSSWNHQSLQWYMYKT